MFLFDLHSHSRYSDGTGTPDQIAKAAADARLNVLCITDHNSNDGPAAHPTAFNPDPRELHDVARALIVRGVQPIIGCEYSTAQGHLLIYGLSIPKLSFGLYPQMQDVVDEVNRLGGACIVPHAFHGYKNALKSGLLHIKGLVAGEGWNARVERSNPGENKLARAACETAGIKTVASTDAHSPSELGYAYNIFPEMVRTDAELVAALRAGEWTPFCDVERIAKERAWRAPRAESFDDYSARVLAKQKARRKALPESQPTGYDPEKDHWIPDAWRLKG